jgi:hypothetical protein
VYRGSDRVPSVQVSCLSFADPTGTPVDLWNGQQFFSSGKPRLPLDDQRGSCHAFIVVVEAADEFSFPSSKSREPGSFATENKKTKRKHFKDCILQSDCGRRCH